MCFDNDLKQLEIKVKEYYINKCKVRGYYEKLQVMEKNIETLKNNLKTNKLSLDTDLFNINYDMHVKTSRISSLDDRLMSAYNKTEEEIKAKTIQMLDEKIKVMQLEEDMLLMDNIIKSLTDEERKFLEMYYRDRVDKITCCDNMAFTYQGLYIYREKVFRNIKERYVM